MTLWDCCQVSEIQKGYCDLLQTESPNPSAIPPVLLSFLDALTVASKCPDSQPPAPKCPDRFYKVFEGAKFLFKTPSAETATASVSADKASKIFPSTSLLFCDKEIKVMERKVYTSAALAIRTMNYQTHMAKYSLALLANAVKLLSELPDSPNKAKLSSILRHSKCSYNAVEALARAAATGSLLRTYSWFRLQTLSDDKAKLMDAPLGNKALFALKLLSFLKLLRKSGGNSRI